MILCLTLISAALHFGWNNGYLAYIFYSQNIAQNLHAELWRVGSFDLSHFWSLAVEEQYYLVWPLVVWLVRDRRKLMRVCLLLIACGALLRVGVLVALSPETSMQWEWTYRELPTHADGILLGSWLALAVTMEAPRQLLRRYRVVWIAACAVLLAVVAYTRTCYFYDYPMQILGFTAIPVVVGGILARALEPGPLARLFSVRPLRFLGKYSYGLYVYHYLFFTVASLFLPACVGAAHSAALGFLLCVTIWIGGSTGIAVLSYELFESRILALKERLAPPSVAVVSR